MPGPRKPIIPPSAANSWARTRVEEFKYRMELEDKRRAGWTGEDILNERAWNSYAEIEDPNGGIHRTYLVHDREGRPLPPPKAARPQSVEERAPAPPATNYERPILPSNRSVPNINEANRFQDQEQKRAYERLRGGKYRYDF